MFVNTKLPGYLTKTEITHIERAVTQRATRNAPVQPHHRTPFRTEIPDSQPHTCSALITLPRYIQVGTGRRCKDGYCTEEQCEL